MQADSEPLFTVSRRQRLALIVCMFLITGAFGFLQPFVPMYLKAARLTQGQIGVVIGVGTGLALLIQPLLGRLSDRLDARRPLMAAAAITAGLAYMGYRSADGMFVLMLLSALGANGTAYLNAAGGVLVGRMARNSGRGGAAYAGYRVWGSVGYIVFGLLTGWLVNRSLGLHAALNRERLAPVFTCGPLLFFVLALVALFVPDRRAADAGTRGHGDTGNGDRVSIENPIHPSSLILHPSINLRWFLLAFFLYQFALYGVSPYLSLYMQSLGGRPFWITSMFAAGVVCEVLMMTQVGRWSDLYGRRPALAVAFLVLPLRLLLYIPANGPLWVLLVQTLHGLNFGIMGAIAIVFINDLASDRNRGAAQARLAGIGGLATALGPVACGWISQKYGMGWMFAAMSAVGAAGAAVFMALVHESHPAPRALAGPPPLRPLLRLLAAPPSGFAARAASLREK
jgi:PPP family 3-phenylpropionic acid transporter